MFKKLFILTVILSLVGCASAMTGAQSPEAAGFFRGFWHGLIAIYSLVAHIFNPDIVVFQTPNNGGWYSFGFLWGSGIIGKCCGDACSRRK